MVTATGWLTWTVTIDAGTPGCTDLTTNKASVSLTSSPSGGTGSYTYVWKDGGATITGATTQNPTVNLGPGDHHITLTITDTSTPGCPADSAEKIVLVNDKVAVTIDAGTPSCTTGTGPGTASVALTSSPSGGTGTYTYVWKDGGATISGATTQNPTVNLAPGDHHITL